MDATSALVPPPSSESNLTKQEQSAMTNTHSRDIPPPPFTNSINELRGLSTALSTFLLRYDELHNHLNFINSCIDSKLRNYLLDTANLNQSALTLVTKPSSDHTATTVPETKVSEPNPNGISLNRELSLRDESEPESPNSSMNTEENVESKKPEETNTAKKPEETKVSEQNPNGMSLNRELSLGDESEPESPSSSMNIEEIVESKKPEETNTAKNPEETKVSEQSPNGISLSPELSLGDESEPESPNSSMNAEEIIESKKPVETDTAKKPEETKVSEQNPNGISLNRELRLGDESEPESPSSSMNREEIIESKKPEETDAAKKPEQTDISKKPSVSELESMCTRMSARELKRYVVTHISDTNVLRDQLPKALKFSKDPAKLVLDSIGRYFLQSSKAYHKGPTQNNQIVGRLASVLLLECFVMISGDGIEVAVKDGEYAAEAAVDWRKRMIREGGLRHREEADARGLLLLISGFGIPDGVFKNKDIRDLIRASNVKGISTALRRSAILIPKIPEIIDWMVKDNLEIEAADIAYTFGLEDKCHPQTILTTFLHDRIKGIQSGSSFQGLSAMKQQLCDLKSVKQCLESNNVDPSELNPDFKINETIQHLEKEINKEKPNQKRKAIKAKSIGNPKHQEQKRARLSHNSQHSQKPVEQHVKSPYNRSTQPSSSYFDFDRNLPNNCISTYSPSSVFTASALPENTTGSVASGLAGSYGTSVYRGAVGAHQMVHTARGQPYGWHEDPALTKKYMGQPYLRQSQTYDSRSSSHGVCGTPSVRSTLESFPGFPGKRGPASDLYGFADAVVEKELRGSRAAGSGVVRASYL